MKKARVFILSGLFIAVLSGLFISAAVFLFWGFRFTPESAARANGSIGNNATLVEKADTAVGNVFVYKKSNYYITVVPHRQGLLWRSDTAFSTEDTDDKNDVVRTVGWYSTTNSPKQGTVLIVQVKDAHVSKIVAGPDSDRVSKSVKSNQYAVFSWDKSYMGWQLNAAALAADGSKLYAEGYPPPSNIIDQKEFRWRKV